MGFELVPLLIWGVVLVGQLVAWHAAENPLAGLTAFAMGWSGFGLGLTARWIEGRAR